MSDVKRCRVNGGNYAYGFYHGRIIVNGVTASRESTTTIYENCYALQCAGYAYYFDSIAGLVVDACAADNNTEDGTYAIRLVSCHATVNGMDAEDNARAIALTDATNTVVFNGGRFIGLAPASIGTTQDNLISVSSNGRVSFNNTRFDVATLNDYDYFVKTTSAAEVIYNSGSTLLSGYTNDVVQGTLRCHDYQCYLRARKANAQSINSAVETLVAFDNDSTSEAFDIGGNFDTGTYTFTAPLAGLYRYTAKLLYNNSALATDGTRFEIRLKLNSSDIDTGYNHAAADDSNVSVGCSGLIYMETSETLKVYAYQNSGLSVPLGLGGNACLLHVERVW
jgi:hypothetical protein